MNDADQLLGSYYDVAYVLEVPPGVSILEVAKYRMNRIKRLEDEVIRLQDDILQAKQTIERLRREGEGK